MANNIPTNPGSGGEVIATDEVSDIHYQLVKIVHGPEDTVDFVSDSKPLPIIDPALLISRGLVTDQAVIHVEGRNPSLGSSAEGIWANSTPFLWPTTAQTVRVKTGGNPADTAAGAGAQSVTVEGLDPNLDFITENIELVGASQSAATIGLFFRVNRCYVNRVGTYTGANTGDIVLENTGSTQVLAKIAAGISHSKMAKWSVRAGYSLFLKEMTIKIPGSKASSIRLWHRDNLDDSVSTPFSPAELVFDDAEFTGSFVNEFSYSHKFEEKTDVWSDGDAASGAPDVNVDLEFVEIKN